MGAGPSIALSIETALNWSISAPEPKTRAIAGTARGSVTLASGSFESSLRFLSASCDFAFLSSASQRRSALRWAAASWSAAAIWSRVIQRP